jgi:hypothetical protein
MFFSASSALSEKSENQKLILIKWGDKKEIINQFFLDNDIYFIKSSD